MEIAFVDLAMLSKAEDNSSLVLGKSPSEVADW